MLPLQEYPLLNRKVDIIKPTVLESFLSNILIRLDMERV